MASVSRPPSTSRVTLADFWSAASSSLEAKVACGHSSSSATICPTQFESSSIACLPMRRRSGFSVSASFWMTRATASGSSACSESTRMARSAPMASPVRSCSCAVFAPIETSTTSLPGTFSFTRSASSIAISSKGLITHLTLSPTMLLPSGAILMTVSGSGTRFTATRIFTRVSSGIGAEGRPLHSAPGPSQVKNGRCSSGLRLAPADVEAEPAGQLASRLEHERRDLLLDALGRQAGGGRRDRQRAYHGARVVAHRRGDGAHVLEVLAQVDGVAARRHGAELLEEGRAVDDGALGEALEAVGDERAQLVLPLEGEVSLAGCGRVERQRLAELRDDAHGTVGLDHLDRDHRRAPQDGEIRRLAHLTHQLRHDRACLAEEPHVLHVALPELEATDAEAVVLGGPVLLDVAARLERGEQAEDVVLVEPEPLRQLGHAELLGLARELLEHIQRVRHRLDDVVGLLAPHCPAP